MSPMAARRAPLVLLLGIYLAVRAGLLLADVLAAHLSYGGHLSGPLLAWDSHLYVELAAQGYDKVPPTINGQLTYSTAVFEPVFPLLIRLGVACGTSYVASALIVSLVSGAAATYLVWRLATLLVDEEVGWASAVLFAVFPGMGIAWGLFYSECVGLALAAGCLLLVLQEKWLWAGILGALATATSPLALPLVLAPLVPAIKDLRGKKVGGAMLATVLTPLGYLGYAGYIGAKYHDALFWWHLQHDAWGAQVDFGRSEIHLLGNLWSGGYQGPGWLEWLGVIAVAGGVAALWKAKLPAPINAYCAGVLVLLFVSNSLGFKPRLLTWAFPILIAVAAAARGRSWQIWAAGFACLAPVVFMAYTTLGNTMIQP
jgi:hypothetical protein